MFLETLRRRNSAFLAVAADLHQRNQIPANSFVLDLEATGRNVRQIADEATRLGLEVFAMTKQVGRHPDFIEVVQANGIDASVAVDMDCARASAAAGLKVGNLGHLVQVPKCDAASAAALAPENWTVFNFEKAREASDAAESLGRTQDLMLRVYAEGDKFYPGHEGGFPVEGLPTALEELKSLRAARVVGITTFPALLFDEPTRTVRLTPNVATLRTAAQHLLASGCADVRVNMPGTTSTATLATLADAGATQVEPGHGLTGTTPLHAFSDLCEEPSCLYLSEVSHHFDDRAYFFGGGLYVDPVFSPYSAQALVFPPGSDEPLILRADLPAPQMIDYYGQLENASARDVPVGSTVILGFRFQAFVTRSRVVAIDQIADGGRVRRICTSLGTTVAWPVKETTK